MEHLRVRLASNWRILVLWVAVLLPVVWGIYYTIKDSLDMMAH
jgi:hypothetical protein